MLSSNDQSLLESVRARDVARNSDTPSSHEDRTVHTDYRKHTDYYQELNSPPHYNFNDHTDENDHTDRVAAVIAPIDDAVSLDEPALLARQDLHTMMARIENILTVRDHQLHLEVGLRLDSFVNELLQRIGNLEARLAELEPMADA